VGGAAFFAPAAGVLVGLGKGAGLIRNRSQLGPDVAAPVQVRPSPTQAPRFRSAAGVATAPAHLVPGGPGYDPVRLAGVLEPEVLFAQEPRDPAWAERMETEVAGIALRDTDRVLPGAKVAAVSCRTTVCRVTWDGPSESRKRLAEIAHVLLPGSFMTAGPGDYFFALSGGVGTFEAVRPGDADGSLRALLESRRRNLAALRRGAPPPRMLAKLDPGAWPVD
jgi:hypothetical protein